MQDGYIWDKSTMGLHSDSRPSSLQAFGLGVGAASKLCGIFSVDSLISHEKCKPMNSSGKAFG
jgi:hypothetical protein